MKKRKARASRKRALARPRQVTVAALVGAVAARLKKARLVFAHGTTDPVAEAAFIVGETLNIHPDHIDARAGMRVTAAQRKKIDALVERRIRTRKPAAYLLKRIYMLGVPFYVDERAIVPRSFLGEILAGELFAGESFSLVRKPESIASVLDLCTGSGCLAILAALRFPNAKVDAVELSKDAIEVAKRNVANHRLKSRVRLLRGDLFAQLNAARYDLIVANPPYVDDAGMALLPPECRHEPQLAFNGGSDGLSVIRRILDEAGQHLNEGGGLLCEVGRGRTVIERAYPGKRFLWLDTEESTGEVFWLDADQLR
ncbi:MAG: ribosomal protein glutamine methyltransferase [Alphaproteobacteria bacterium]|nr:ribosomal protein glutamine methyltransferase [Alphaproteobacteria bacterium]